MKNALLPQPWNLKIQHIMEFWRRSGTKTPTSSPRPVPAVASEIQPSYVPYDAERAAKLRRYVPERARNYVRSLLATPDTTKDECAKALAIGALADFIPLPLIPTPAAILAAKFFHCNAAIAIFPTFIHNGATALPFHALQWAAGSVIFPEDPVAAWAAGTVGLAAGTAALYWGLAQLFYDKAHEPMIHLMRDIAAD